MKRKVKRLMTLLPLCAISLLGSGSFYGWVHVHADAVKGTTNVTYTPGDTPIPGDGWTVIIPTSYDFTAGNNPTQEGKTGTAIEGTVKLTDPYGNTYKGDKIIDVKATSTNGGLLKDTKGNGNATYQLQDDKGTPLKFDGSVPIASLAKETDSKPVNAALTKGEKGKGKYSDILTFSAQEQTTP